MTRQSGPVILDGYGGVAAAFDRVMARVGGGGGLAVHRNGELVLSVVAGETTNGTPWERDTVAVGWSTTKGVTALVVQALVERGLVALDEPIASYWDDFGTQGKEQVTLRHVLTHTAGLPFWPGSDQLVAFGSSDGWDREQEILAALAAAPVQWPAGAAMSYHAFTYGWLLDGAVSHATGQTLDAHLDDLVNRPLGLSLAFGVPDGAKVADLRPTVMPADPELRAQIERTCDPATLAGAAMLSNGRDSMRDAYVTANSESFRRARMPGANAFVSAESLSRMYAALANGGQLDGVQAVSPTSIAQHSRAHESGVDLVLGTWMQRGLGYVRTCPGESFSLQASAFGHSGLGGQLGFADPSLGLAFGFVTDTPILGELPDWRTSHLVGELYAAVSSGGVRTHPESEAI